MKKNIIKNPGFRNLQQAFALLVLILAGALSSCELLPQSKCEDDPKACGGENTACNTYVTAQQITCGGGEFGSIWLKLDNGNYLQPYENATGVTTLEAGKRYLIGFEYLNTTKPHSNQAVCLAVTPPSKPIRLQCISAEETTTCDTYATATNVICSVGAFGDTWLKLDNGEYLQPWENQSDVTELVKGQRYKIGYQTRQKDNRYDNQNVCLAMPSDSLAWNPKIVTITCVSEAADTGGN